MCYLASLLPLMSCAEQRLMVAAGLKNKNKNALRAPVFFLSVSRGFILSYSSLCWRVGKFLSRGMEQAEACVKIFWRKVRNFLGSSFRPKNVVSAELCHQVSLSVCSAYGVFEVNIDRAFSKQSFH
jgi:hypothetical protein